MGADLGVPLSDLRPLCVSVAGGESRKTFTQFSKREKREKLPTVPHRGEMMQVIYTAAVIISDLCPHTGPRHAG